MLLPLLRHMVPLVNERCARVLKSGEEDYITIERIYNESANLIGGYNVAFGKQMLVEFPTNGASDLHCEYGDTRGPSLHARLLDAEHMTPS